jgi:hypothetical protein
MSGLASGPSTWMRRKLPLAPPSIDFIAGNCDSESPMIERNVRWTTESN